MPDSPTQTTVKQQPRRFIAAKIGGFSLMALFALLIITLTIGIRLDLTGYRNDINKKLTDAIGRTIAIRGDMALTVSFRPSFRFTEAEIADCDPMMGPMATAGVLEAKMAVLPLLAGTVSIHSANIENIQLNLSRDFDGNANWVFKETAKQPEQPAETKENHTGLLPFKLSLSDSIKVKSIQLYYSDQLNSAFFDWGLDTMTIKPEGDSWQLNANGFSMGYPYTLTLHGNIEQLINEQLADLTLKGEFAGADLSVSAGIVPFDQGDSDISVELNWQDTAPAEQLLGLEIAPAAPLSLKTHLQLGKAHLKIPELSISSPVTSANGWLNINRGDHSTIDGQLTLPFIDFSPWVQPAPQPEPQMFGYSSAPPAKSPLQLALEQWLTNTTTHVKLQLGEVKGLGADINNISLTVTGKDGILQAPMTADIADVPFRGQAMIDDSGWAPKVNITLGADDAPLGTLASWLSGIDDATGHLKQAQLVVSTDGTKLEEWITNSQVEFNILDTQVKWGKQASWAIDKARFTAGMIQETHIHIAGQLMGIPAQLDVTGDSLSAAIQHQNWQTDIRFKSPALNLSAKGELVAGQWQNGSWLNLNVVSRDIRKMSTWLGTLPDVQGQLKLIGKLSSDGEWVHINMTPVQLLDTKGKLTARWRPAKNLLFLSLDGQLENLDLTQLSDWVTGTSKKDSNPDKPITDNADQTPGVKLDLPLLSSAITIADADLALGIKRLVWDNHQVENIKFNGLVRDGWLQKAPFSAHYAEGRYKGNMQLDLRHPVIKAGFELSVTTPDIGQMMANFNIAKQLNMQLNSASLHIALQGRTLWELASQASVEASMKGGFWNASDSYTGKQFAVALDHGHFTTAPDTGTHLSIHGTAGDLPLAVTLDAESLAHIQSNEKQFPVTLDVELGDTTFSAESLIKLPLDKQKVTLAIHGFTPNLNRFNRFTGVELPPYGPITLAGNFSMDDLGYQLKDLLIKVNSSYLKGQGSFLPPKTERQKPTINLALTAPFIQLNDFGVKDWKAWLPTENAEKTNTRPTHSPPLPEKVEKAETATVPLVSPDSLGLYNASFTLDVNEVRSGEDWLGAGQFHWHLKDSQLMIKPLAVEIPGGSIGFSGEIKAVNNAFDIHLNGGAEHFNYGILARRLKPETDMSGTVSVKLDLHSQSKTPEALMDHATGAFGFAAWPEKFEAGVIDLWAVGLVDAVLPTLNPKNTSMLNCAAGSFIMKDGTMQQKKLLLDTSKIQVSGDIEADFGNKTFSMYLAPRSKKAEIFSLQTPIKVEGKFKDFSFNVPLSAILKTSVQFTTSPVISPLRWFFETPLDKDGSQLCEEIMNEGL